MKKILRALLIILGIVISLNSIQAQTSGDLTKIGQGTQLYLRCNATGWDVNDQTHLTPTAEPYLLEIVYEVKEWWMLSLGDDCIITETPELNSWGAWNRSYGGQLSTLKAPESSRLRIQENQDDSINFKIIYPTLGRYRFTINTRDGYFSVNKASPALAGDVSWTLPGSISTDMLGRIFLSNSFPQNSLSLIDPQSGLPRWTYTANSYLSFYANCSSQSLAFATRNGHVVALSMADGQEKWQTDLNGALKEGYAYLNCYPNSDKMFVSYGSDRSILVGLDKATGKILWSRTPPLYAGILGVSGQYVYVTSYRDTFTLLRAIDVQTGNEIWSTQESPGYYSIAEDGLIYLTHDQNMSRIDSDTGATVWTYTGQPDDYIWLSHEKNELYLHEKNRISSVNKQNGQLKWSYDFNQYAPQFPYVKILKAGVVLIHINDFAHSSSKQIAIDSDRGQQIWERIDQQLADSIAEDNQGGVWALYGKTIRSIDPSTGTERWSFTLSSTNPLENIMGILECTGDNIYISYGIWGGKFPPMGVIALNVKTGQLNWQNWLQSYLYKVAGDQASLILIAGYNGSVKALKK